MLSMMLAVADPVRLEAKEVLQALRNRGISVWIISGDNPIMAHVVGKIVGISPGNIIEVKWDCFMLKYDNSSWNSASRWSSLDLQQTSHKRWRNWAASAVASSANFV